jgi:hypothetical protein
MERVWKRPAQVLSGLLLAAMYAMPQAYTVSAKPGAINYIEGEAFLNNDPLSDKGLRAKFLGANDVLSTDHGKAEVLLSPGVFLRLGEDSRVRMVSPSLVDTQVEVDQGEVMLEAAGLIKGSSIQVIDHGSTTIIDKNGLYRFTADDPPTAAVLDGKALVTFGDRKVNLKKGRETVLAENLKEEKFDAKRDDELYAWSNVRSAYEAAASYRVSQTAYNSGLGAGLNGFYNPGWYWDNGFSSWAWLPGTGAFYSPFGYGFYSPGLVAYAPVVTVPVYRGGAYVPGKGYPVPGNGWHGHPTPGNGWHGHPAPGTVAGTNGIVTNVPVSPKNPPAVGATAFAGSPWANHEARMEAARSWAASGGFHTASGAPAPNFAGRGAATSAAGPSGSPHAMGGAPAGGGFHGGGGHPGGGGFAGGGGHPGGGFAGGGGGHAPAGGGASPSRH